jgi:hypothetical protein
VVTERRSFSIHWPTVENSRLVDPVKLVLAGAWAVSLALLLLAARAAVEAMGEGGSRRGSRSGTRPQHLDDACDRVEHVISHSGRGSSDMRGDEEGVIVRQVSAAGTVAPDGATGDIAAHVQGDLRTVGRPSDVTAASQDAQSVSEAWQRLRAFSLEASPDTT